MSLQRINEDMIDKKFVDRVNNLGSQLTQNTNDIDQRGIDIKKFGVVGDGVTDDTENIQNALDSGKKIFWSDGEYYFKQIFIEKDDTHIIFDKNVILKSDYAVDHLDESSVVITGSIISTHAIVQDVSEGDRKIYLSSVNDFSVGDFVDIRQDNPEGSSTDLTIHRQKYVRVMMKVVGVNTLENYLELENPSPHAFQVANNCRLYKVKPIKNLVLEGANTVFDKMGTETYTSNIRGEYLYNPKIKGFNFINGGGKGLVLSKTYRFEVEDIVHTNPTNTTAGHGYGVQFLDGTGYGTAKNIIGYESRHTIDFSGGTHNIAVYDSYGSDISGHGSNNKFITLVNCHTKTMGMGNSGTEGNFQSDEHWTFTDCTTNGGNLYVTAQSFGAVFNNCEVKNGTFFINTGSKDIKGTIVKSKGKNSNGVEIRGVEVDIDIIEIENSSLRYRGKNTSIGTLILNDSFIRSDQESKNLIIGILKATGENETGRVLIAGGDADNIVIKHIDADVSATRIIESLETSNIPVREITILGGKMKSDGGQSFFTKDAALKLENTVIHNNMLIDDNDGHTVIKGNELVGVVAEIRTTKNTIIKDNYGTGALNTPDESETVIVKDNLVS